MVDLNRKLYVVINGKRHRLVGLDEVVDGVKRKTRPTMVIGGKITEFAQFAEVHTWKVYEATSTSKYVIVENEGSTYDLGYGDWSSGDCTLYKDVALNTDKPEEPVLEGDGKITCDDAWEFLDKSVDVDYFEDEYGTMYKVISCTDPDELNAEYTNLAYRYVEIVGVELTVEKTETHVQGSQIGTVQSTDSTAYPTNGVHTDGRWYVLQTE